MSNKAVFFDRDGIINKAIVKNGKPYSPKNLDEFEFTNGILDCFFLFPKYHLFIITNQPDVARKKQSKKNIEEINNYICEKLPITRVYCCYHDDKDDCDCRKPKPGMILQAAELFKIDLKKSWVIGDRDKDIEAGISAGCKTIFVDYNYDNDCLKCEPDYIVKSVRQALKLIRDKS